MDNTDTSLKTYDELLETKKSISEKALEDLDKVDSEVAERLFEKVFELVKLIEWEVDEHKPNRLVFYKSWDINSIRLLKLLTSDIPGISGKIYRLNGVIVYSKDKKVYMEGEIKSQKENAEPFHAKPDFRALVEFTINNSIKTSFYSLEKNLEEARLALGSAKTSFYNYAMLIEQSKLLEKSQLTPEETERLQYLSAKVSHLTPRKFVTVRTSDQSESKTVRNSFQDWPTKTEFISE